MVKISFRGILYTLYKSLGSFYLKKGKSNLEEVSRGYQEIFRGKKRWVSKRGDAPNRRTGNLKRSMRSAILKSGFKVTEGGSKSPYVVNLEAKDKLNRPNFTGMTRRNEASIKRLATSSLVDYINTEVRRHNAKHSELVK